MSNPYRAMAKKFGAPYEPGITRDLVLERDDWLCKMDYCYYESRAIDPHLKRVGNGPIPEDMGTIDHIVPLSQPGTPGHVWSNVRAAHRLCNREDFTPSRRNRAPVTTTGHDPRDEWAADDLQQAKHVWTNIALGPRRLLELLLDAPGPLLWTELAKGLGPGASDDTVFGSFGNPAKLAKEVGRKHIVTTRPTPIGNAYSLEPTVKKLFNRVRRELAKTPTAALESDSPDAASDHDSVPLVVSPTTGDSTAPPPNEKQLGRLRQRTQGPRGEGENLRLSDPKVSDWLETGHTSPEQPVSLGRSFAHLLLAVVSLLFIGFFIVSMIMAMFRGSDPTGGYVPQHHPCWWAGGTPGCSP
jgi:5-methylcytosine-specific restriction endonuclease McrA